MTFIIIFINPFLGIEIYSSHLALQMSSIWGKKVPLAGMTKEQSAGSGDTPSPQEIIYWLPDSAQGGSFGAAG